MKAPDTFTVPRDLRSCASILKRTLLLVRAMPNKTLQPDYAWAVSLASASSRRTMRPNTPAIATQAVSVSWWARPGLLHHRITGRHSRQGQGAHHRPRRSNLGQLLSGWSCSERRLSARARHPAPSGLGGALAMSSMTLAELLHGAEKSNRVSENLSAQGML